MYLRPFSLQLLLLKHLIGRHLFAFFCQKVSSVVASEKGKALHKHKSKSTMSSMETTKNPDSGDGDEELAKEPTKKSPPRGWQGSTMKGTPARKSPPKPLPMLLQGPQGTKAQQPPRKNPPEAKKVKEEQQDTQPKGRGSQSHPNYIHIYIYIYSQHTG